MKTNNYKMLVLSDLKEDTEQLLKSSIGLAKMVDAELCFFHVKKAGEVVGQESQLSAIREINHVHTDIGKRLEALIGISQENYGITIKHSHTIGNVKNDIKEHIDTLQPDIIVLGKRKTKPLQFLGDSVTDFVIKNYGGVILIVDGKNTIQPDETVSLGVLNSVTKPRGLGFTDDLMRHTQKPITSFKIVKQGQNAASANHHRDEVVEYVFEQNDHSFKSLSNYVKKNKINLLYIDRADNDASKSGPTASNIREMTSQLNVSLLLSGQKQTMLSQ